MRLMVIFMGEFPCRMISHLIRSEHLFSGMCGTNCEKFRMEKRLPMLKLPRK